MNPYINLFGEAAAEPGVRAPRAVATPTRDPAFVSGAVRYSQMDVAWLDEDGQTVTLTLTARAAQALLVKPVSVEDPAVPGERTRKAPHVRGSATSEAAAVQVTRKLAGKRLSVMWVVMRADAIPGRAGFTDNELTAWMVQTYEWSPNTARPRRIELTRDGWLEDSGERRSSSIVWRPTQKAWEWWKQQQNGSGE